MYIFLCIIMDYEKNKSYISYNNLAVIMFIYFKLNLLIKGLVWLMVFNATFNNISAISWWSVLFVEETGGPGENHTPVASHKTNFITQCCTPHPDRDLNSQHQW